MRRIFAAWDSRNAIEANVILNTMRIIQERVLEIATHYFPAVPRTEGSPN